MKIIFLITLVASFLVLKTPGPEIKTIGSLKCKYIGTIQQGTLKNCLRINLKSAGMNTHLGQNIDYFIFKMDGTFVSKITIKITSNPQWVPLSSIASNTDYRIGCALSFTNTTASNYIQNELKSFNTGTLPCTRQAQLPVKTKN
jgi:hypothetical protein